jgi:hypothetical protein
MPNDHKRPAGFAERVMMDLSLVAQRAGLTPHETMVLGAQFTGLAAVDCTHAMEGLEAVLELARHAMNTAAVGKVQVRLGNAHPVRQ